MVRLLLIVGFAGIMWAQSPAKQPPPANATPPGTDIYELAFDGTAGGLRAAQVAPVATAPGYDNQPHYLPGGRALLFTANRDGKQTDIYEFDRTSRSTRQLTRTAESEYSATATADGAGFSVIRVEADGTQRLWRFDRAGANPRLVLTEIKPVGYHAWIDADRLALFILGQPATLQLVRVGTGKAEVIARDIGRSIQRRPGGALVSIVQREAGEFWVKSFDPATGALTPLTRVVAGSAERDTAWLPDGTLLMSAGTRIMAWKAGDSDWREVLDVTAHQLGAVTRMTTAPDGKVLAIVVAEAK